MRCLILFIFASIKDLLADLADEAAARSHSQHQSAFPCYNEINQAQRCVPEFVNAAFNRRVDATNTCGEYRPIQYCVQSGHSGMIKDCDICDARVPARGHSAMNLIDFNNPENETWWQSETMNENIQYPNMVNLTLNLGKAFDITYVRLKFHSPRPESFAIYKKSRSNDTWIPWQYYSATCRTTYGTPDKAPILYNAETVAQCTSEYSDISPLTGADVAFSTLEGRPSAQNFENSPVLQDWVTATEIRIVLNRLNTFGDEVFRDDKVLRSYYYAISDFAVGGRCKCNGHASECVKSTGVGVERLVCSCEHNTMGEDCDQCKPFYNDRPWKPATADDANECRPCDCNGLSSRCYFDDKMFEQTGSGGHCIDCVGSTRGPHCESCLENYFRRPGEKYCSACNCNEMGSLNLQCDEEGKCMCKHGVTGQYCDRCLPGYYEFSIHGCKHCGCDESGSLNNEPHCRPDTGVCSCKKYVEGKKCDRCIPGHFLLDKSNEFGCTPCFCHGHSSVCSSAVGYYKNNLTSDFSRGTESWKLEGPTGRQIEAQYNERDKNIAATEFGGSTYFVAPEKYLGDKRHSYNQHLSFKLRVVDRNGRASVRDIILQGAGGKSVSAPIFAQNNNPPDVYEQTYRYLLHDDSKYQWTPDLEPFDFMSILSNLTAIKIRATYAGGDVGFLDDFTMGTASLVPSSSSSNGGNGKALWVESCTCPDGFVGQNCEACAPGYRREPKNGGPFARCVKCQCHNHSELCDAESGRCICQHDTAGDMCERCARGFYGNALKGTADDCQPCPCPNQGPCILHTDNDVICLECAPGYAGRLCDICADGYYGDPKNGVECKLCECSGNIDPNSIGNCDRVSGECKKCIHNTQGFHCENCAPGFYGDALLEPKGDCQRCNCYAPGTDKPNSNYKQLECAQESGQCRCLPNVVGRACDECAVGYYNISSGLGCQSCNCDPLGSASSACDPASGQCRCKPGIVGKRCDQCQALHFGFGVDGCQACDCLPVGSLSPQCDPATGQCQCRSTVEGRRCDQCMENKHSLHAGCLDCEPCYGLVQRRVHQHRAKLSQLRDLLRDVLQNPTVVNDTSFDNKLREVLKNVEVLAGVVTARMALENGDRENQIKYLANVLNETNAVFDQIQDSLQNTTRFNDQAKHSLSRWEQIRADIEDKLKQAHDYLKNEGATAWEEAKLAADMHGQQSSQLTKTAEEARQLAAKHKNDADKIEEHVELILNATRQADKGADDAIYGGPATSQDISRLKNQLFPAVDSLFNQTQTMAKEHKERAEHSHIESAAILNKVDAVKVPVVDVDKMNKAALDAWQEAKETREKAESMARDNQPLVERARQQDSELRAELQRLTSQQQQADRILADEDATRDRGAKAVETSQNTLRDAKQTLKTFGGFNDLVERSKVDAVAAMAEVPQIEKTIQDAEERKNRVQAAIGSAGDDAANAHKIAVEAQKVAEEASKEAAVVSQDAAETAAHIVNLVGEADKVKQEMTSKAQLLENYKTNAKQDKIKAQTALAEASAADVVTQKTLDSYKAALSDVKLIHEQIHSAEVLKPDEIARLRAQLDEYKPLVPVLEKQMSDLKRKREEQERKISAMLSEYDRLKAEVANLKEIADSLPSNRCFNVVELEGSRRR